jgi:hypothetical protein
MPRTNKENTNATYSSATNTTFPRVSYTGPIMPRSSPVATPMQVSNPTFMQTLKEGFALGTGASIARNIIDRLFGSNSPAPPLAPPSIPQPPLVKPPAVSSIEPIGEDQLLYHKCMQEGDPKSLARHEYCKNYLV